MCEYPPDPMSTKYRDAQAFCRCDAVHLSEQFKIELPTSSEPNKIKEKKTQKEEEQNKS